MGSLGMIRCEVRKDKWEKPNVIHRASNKKFAINVGESTADPVAMRTDDLDTVAEGRRYNSFAVTWSTYVVAISQIRTVWSRLELMILSSPGKNLLDETECSCPLRVAKF